MAIKMDRAKWIILGFFVVALILFALNFNKSIPLSKQSANPNAYIDPAIYAEFENGSKWVKVIVELDSKEATNKLIASLAKSEFNLTDTTYWGNSFFGFTTRKGLNKIINNPNVTAVYFSKVMTVD